MKSATFFRWLIVLSLFPTFLFSQQAMQVKLKLFSYDTWGVYVKPINGISPGTQTITGTAQVTVVMPKNYAWNSTTSVHGSWAANTIVNGPIENPTKMYVSFGLQVDNPHINYVAGQETLLFKFKRADACPDSIYIINNATDPFNQLPNSVNNNPGNEFSVFDPNGPALYEYHSNYAPSAWSCHDNDGDAVLNAFEDTNGNGIFDAGDASNLNEHNGGMNLKLQLIEDDMWGVFVKPDSTIMPGPLTITGTAQVTVVAPKNYYLQYYSGLGLVSANGTWAANANSNGPMENPTKQYISIGLLNDFPHIDYVAGQETLLFTFQGNGTCPDSLYLINNGTDPFNQLPNSVYSNPGNEITIYDPIGPVLYGYHSNYAPSAWSCHDNDGDGMLNAFEDTNGNGVYDAGVDVSDLNQNYCTVTFSNDPDDITVCSGNDTVFVASASMPQGTFSFGWQYSDDNGVTWVDIDFETMAALFAHSVTGDVASGTDVLTVKNVAGMYGRRFRAVANATDCSAVYSNYAILSVEGPLSVNTHPTAVTECSSNSTIFTASFVNPGVVGSTIYRWQISADGGTNWFNLSNAGVYNGTATTQLSVNNVAGLHNICYRLSARTSTCNIMYTNPAMLTVEGPLTILYNPEDFTDCADKEAYFFANVSNPGQGYVYNQWQMSANGGNTWTDINQPIDTINGHIVNFGGFDSDSLLMTPLIGMNSYRFRNRFWTNSCDEAITAAATLHVEGPLTFTDQPDDITTCSGASTCFTVAIANATGNGTIQYTWQRWTAAGWWVVLTNSAPYSGTFTNQLCISSTTGLYNDIYRCKVKTGNCEWLYSDPAILTVQDCPDACLKLKLKLLPDSSGWAVMAKPFGGYVPSANAMTTTGRVTLVAPANFVLDGLTNVGGAWTPTSVLSNVPGHPGRKYITFELANSAQGTQIPYDFDQAITLFQFEKNGTCPDSLYLLESAVANIPPNELNGQDVFGLLPFEFEYCGIYARKAWRCKPLTAPSGPIIIVTTDSLGAPQPEATDRDTDFSEGKTAEGQWFTASPNPAGDFVNIVLSADLSEGRPTLTLWDLQGKKRQEMVVENAATQLDLSDLPTGVYLISLTQNGRVVEWKKLVKN